ncbi:MAG: hypothetical protein ACTSR2_00885 [Candidatus Hodarchaeales archaeon]
MEKKIIKEAFGEAQKQAEKEKREKIKKVILETLRKLEDLKEERDLINKKIKILKKDLEDFKNGRLDLIEERLRTDKLAKETSVVKLKKVSEGSKPWYETYKIELANPVYYYDTDTWSIGGGTGFTTQTSGNILCSGTDFHIHFSGSYDIGGEVINL